MIFFTYLRIFFHIVYALCLCFIFFPWLSKSKKNYLIQYWCGQLLKILDVHLKVHQKTELPDHGFLIVSNHISWLDIHVINAFMPTRFIAKSELASWPIFGWLADQLNTLYIKRGRTGEAKKMVDIVSQSLVNGDRICFFPEGTSSDGQDVLEFKSNLFQAGIDANVPCLPIALDYLDHKTGMRTFSPSFIGDMGLIESITRIVRSPKISVNLYLGEEAMQTQDRKRLAKESRQMIRAMRAGIE
jgi:1-acyl-sn-glycerol-3-phosphate acyltransferase